MSEYLNVEKPFLDQLAALGWEVIDQGEGGVPTDPSISFRTDFRDVGLRDVFFSQVRAINTTDNGQQWLTDRQLEELYESVTRPASGTSLVEINENIQKLLFRSQVGLNELTGEIDPNVQLIDFERPERNRFTAINQFRIDTPGRGKVCIIPDIVLFVNGLPLVVIECKTPDQVHADAMREAFIQLMRYSNQRPDTHKAGLAEGEPRLFYTNQFIIRTCGEECEFGSITATDEEFYYPWRDIYPPRFRTYKPPLGQQRRQETLIQGMLPPCTLLDIVRNCTVFMDVGKIRVKIVCRCQQYRAVGKIVERLRSGGTPDERSGVVWHTQGSGKSLTMVFLIRKIRMCDDLRDLKICLINDRVDLERQLGETAELTGEKVTRISSRAELRSKLATDASNLNLVMIHKFHETETGSVDYIDSVLEIPRFESFGVVNPSQRILLMIDEAHRSQSGDCGDNLFEAFPGATRLAFTGTPLIVVDAEKRTIRRFGDYIDKYMLQDAVDDGATVQILYEGRTADSAIEHKPEFDERVEALATEHVEAQMRKAGNVERLRQIAEREKKAFDDLVRERSDAEILALKKKWGTTGDILEADERIQAIARDIVAHYVDFILPNGFKAQVVCSSKMAAVKYKQFIDEALAERLAIEEAKPPMPDPPPANADSGEYRSEELCCQIAFLQSAVVVSSDATNEPAVITKARKHAREVLAVDNFKRAFDYEDPARQQTGIAFLIVCDMLLTGFDAPIEQVMYIDKKVKAHNLLQTIARVNRVARDKKRGYIVDYIGLAQHLKDALSIYAADDQKEIEDSLLDIASELPVLENRFRRLVNLFFEKGVKRIEPFVRQTIDNEEEERQVLQQAVDLMEDVQLRTNFEVYLKAFMSSMDIILPGSEAAPYRIPAKRFGFLMMQVRERYKDETLGISGAGEKVRRLIDEYLISLGIDSKIPPVELLSPQFVKQIEQNTSSKAAASEMEHAIRRHCKVHFEEDPAFYTRLSEKLETLIKKYRDDWDELMHGMQEIREEAEGGRKEEIEGVSPTAAPFYDLIVQLAFSDDMPEAHASRVKQLTSEIIVQLQRTIDIVNFWSNGPETSRLRGKLSDLMLATGIDEIIDHCDKLVTEITELAKNREQDLLK